MIGRLNDCSDGLKEEKRRSGGVQPTKALSVGFYNNEPRPLQNPQMWMQFKA